MQIGGTAGVLSDLPSPSVLLPAGTFLRRSSLRYGPAGQLETPEPASVTTDTKAFGAVADLGTFPLASEDDPAR